MWNDSGPRGVEDEVEPRPPQRLARGLGVVDLAVVERLRDAHRLQSTALLVAARRGVELDVEGAGEVDDGQADAAGAAVHQHPVARSRGSDVHECQVRREVVDGNGGGLGKGRVVADLHGGVGRDAHGVGVAPEARDRHHARAGLQVRVGLGPDLLHDARDLVAGGVGELRRVGVEPDASHQVREVHARGLDADAHVLRFEARLRQLAFFEDRRGAVPGNDDGAHQRMVAEGSRPLRHSPPAIRFSL